MESGIILKSTVLRPMRTGSLRIRHDHAGILRSRARGLTFIGTLHDHFAQVLLDQNHGFIPLRRHSGTPRRGFTFRILRQGKQEMRSGKIRAEQLAHPSHAQNAMVAKQPARPQPASLAMCTRATSRKWTGDTCSSAFWAGSETPTLGGVPLTPGGQGRPLLR